ncbi:hypothetical protein DUNSADRAFT_17766 [Dunaliella salina]|uniref:Encoded protein n=1 Tax=Dunaliella salina TaxID=3046 RepID=A0ABQ7G170_DUNSA|nr:hypothetical protein DUNSADRAFT_17766 [Dunaliella salina]|eukprot:KAF5828343.1 hypothetical protein DUNSADRAFT_17766 [Dunaliella salina]
MAANNFEDVHEVVTNEEKRRIFCELCPEAMMIWAEMDDLSCSCENDVAVALGYWSTGEQGRKSATSVNKRLSLSLRVSELTKSFRYFILPWLPFFTEHKQLSHVNLMDSEEPSHLARGPQWSAWFDKRARRGRLLFSRGFELIGSRYECTWEIPGHLITAEAEAVQAGAEAQVLQGPLLYVKGFFLRLKCDVWDDWLRVSVAPEGSGVIPQPLCVAASARICHVSPSGKEVLASMQEPEYFTDETFEGRINFFEHTNFFEPNPLNGIIDRNGNCVITLLVQDVK